MKLTGERDAEYQVNSFLLAFQILFSFFFSKTYSGHCAKILACAKTESLNLKHESDGGLSLCALKL